MDIVSIIYVCAKLSLEMLYEFWVSVKVTGLEHMEEPKAAVSQTELLRFCLSLVEV